LSGLEIFVVVFISRSAQSLLYLEYAKPLDVYVR